MNRPRMVVLFSVVGVTLLFWAQAAPAQFNRVFVSARSGHDVNSSSSCPGMTAPCCPQGNDINTPCQTFQGAVNQVAASGTVIVLDTGGYGPVTINKAVTIDASPGITAFIHPPTGNAITVNAGASDTVVLRGIELNVGDAIGLHVSTAGAVHVENCTINGFAGQGLLFAATGQLFVKDTTLANNGQEGLLINPLSGPTTASIDRCRLDGNAAAGLTAGFNSSVTVRDSVAGGNFRGFQAGTANGQTIQLNLERCVSANNFVGVFAADGAGTVVRVSDTVVTNNNLGLEAQGAGTILTRVNNTVEGNGANQTFSGSYAAK